MHYFMKLNTSLFIKVNGMVKICCFIGKFDPSSKTCSNCGTIKRDLTLDDRTWICSKCNTEHDRDVNAANNIKTFCLRNKLV